MILDAYLRALLEKSTGESIVCQFFTFQCCHASWFIHAGAAKKTSGATGSSARCHSCELASTVKQMPGNTVDRWCLWKTTSILLKSVLTLWDGLMLSVPCSRQNKNKSLHGSSSKLYLGTIHLKSSVQQLPENHYIFKFSSVLK